MGPRAAAGGWGALLSIKSFLWVTGERSGMEGVYSAPSSTFHTLLPPYLGRKIRIKCVEESNPAVSSSEQVRGE